jgi:hypothetical protein
MRRGRGFWRLRRGGRDRQRLLPFLERSDRRQRLFKRMILVATTSALVAMVGAIPAGRYQVRLWSGQARDELAMLLFGMPPGRDRIDAEWRVRRGHGIELTEQSLANFYRDTSEEMRALFRVAGMDPDHALIRCGRADQAFVISPQVFEPDERGRSYRLRPNLRSIWLRQITLRNGPFGLFQVLDTPEHRAAAVRAGAIVDEGSAQRTNSWGLRGPEPDLSAPVRGIVLGDSFMQGMFVGDEQTPPLCLERYLRSAWKVPVTIVNTGHIGYSPEQYYYALREFGERVNPQFVVVSVCPNDFGDGLSVLRGGGDGFEEAEFWLGEIQRWCHTRVIPWLLVVVPTHIQIERIRSDAFYPGRVCTIAHANPECYCDPLNEFTDEYMKEWRAARAAGKSMPRCSLYNYAIDDDHFSPRGATLWAEIVGRRLTMLVDLNPPAGAPAVVDAPSVGAVARWAGPDRPRRH